MNDKLSSRYFDNRITDRSQATVNVRQTLPVQFSCNCSKERIEKALVSVGEKDLKDMIADGKPIEVNCHFCNTNYTFTIEDLQGLLKRAKRK